MFFLRGKRSQGCVAGIISCGSCRTVFVGLPVVVQDRQNLLVLPVRRGLLCRLLTPSGRGAAAVDRCRFGDLRTWMFLSCAHSGAPINRDDHKSFPHVPPLSGTCPALDNGKVRSRRARAHTHTQTSARSRGDLRSDPC